MNLFINLKLNFDGAAARASFYFIALLKVNWIWKTFIVENCKNTSFTYWSTANDPIFVASLAFIRKYI